MTKEQFLADLKDTLQTQQNLEPNTNLDEIFEWDSMAFLAVISLFDELFDIKISTDEIKSCKTILDIINLSKGKIL